MSQLGLIIKNEFLTDVRGKSFWISTILVPIIIIAFGAVFGFLMKDADSFNNMASDLPTQPDPEEMTAAKAIGMLMGMSLTFFLMIYGAMIFVGIIGFYMVFQFAIPWEYLTDPRVYLCLLWMVLYFIGGYILFGSLYAACGAITDKDNENQAYMTVITFILLGAFYIGMYAVDNGNSALSTACNYIPFTSPTIGTINAISGVSPIWQTLISLVILYATAYMSVVFAGKLYRSSMLLKGKQFTPKDIITFIKTS